MIDLREMIRPIVDREERPRAAEIDGSGEYPRDMRELLAEQDMLGLAHSEAYGGTGSGELMLCAAIEEVAKACASCALMLAAQDLSSIPIRCAGSARAEGADPAVDDRAASASARSASRRPRPGPTCSSMRTRADRVGRRLGPERREELDHQRLGRRLYVVFAVSDRNVKASRGITAFLVPAKSPGFSVGKLEHKMGMRGSPTGPLSFEDVFVPDRT